MKRKEFIRTGSVGCAAILLGGPFLHGCAGSVAIKKTINNGVISLSTSDFLNENGKVKRYITIKADTLDFPIVVYRNSDMSYRAYLLKCTHQGTQLNVHGDLISCPAHGSEFGKSGQVISGPATSSLLEYDISQNEENLYIKIA